MIVRAHGVGVEFPRGFLRRRVRALDGLSLEVRAGDVFALLGRNGAGKSTAMYCLLGLLQPTRGRVELFGHRPDPGSRVYGKVAYLPEEPHYHGYLTVREAARYYAGLSRGPVPEAEIGDALERLGLGSAGGTRLARCSKGMKQKLGIAQCLLARPELLFLDEPMRGLDPISVRDFRNVLREMNRDGTTIVVNSHMLAEVEQLATRAAILDAGRLRAEGSLAELTRASEDTYSVEVAGSGALPEYARPEPPGAGSTRATIPVERLHDFMGHVRDGGLRLVRCELRRSTLEESFAAILSGEAR